LQQFTKIVYASYSGEIVVENTKLSKHQQCSLLAMAY